MTIFGGGKSTATHELANCPCDGGKDNTTNPKLLKASLSLKPSRDGDNDPSATGTDGDDNILDVPAKGLLVKKEAGPQEVVPALKGDIDAKHTVSTSTSQLKAVDAITIVDRADRTDIDEIMPQPPSALRRHQRVSRPGAYPQSSAVGYSSRFDDENANVDTGHTGDAGANRNNEEDLVMANLVEHQSMQFALPDSDSKEHARKSEKKTRQYKTFILLSVFSLLATGAVLLAFLNPSPSDSVDQESQYDVDNLTTTAFPSQAPTSLEGYVLSLLPNDTTNAILDDSSSPQSRAFHWLLDDDLLHMPDEQIKQRFALATLYFATEGDDWAENTKWLNHSVSECEWYTKGEFIRLTYLSALFPGFMEGFFSTAEGPTTICDSHGIYQHLWLDDNKVARSLPEELFMLTHLQTISMSFNGLQGTISTKIGLLTDLEGWGMLYSGIGGTIPTEIGLLTKLRLISSDDNGHSGSMPAEIWQLTQLEFVSLSRNRQLEGTIPTEIGTFRNLRGLSVDETGLFGTIPTEIAQLQSIKILSLNINKLWGHVPSELGLLTVPYYIGLAYNDLTGPIPTELGLLTSLSQLSLHSNHLEGAIPSYLGVLTNLAWSLNLRQNQLSGTIPSELGLLTKLTELEFRDNRLTGQIPSELGQAKSMEFLSFANNSLSGSVPHELFSLHTSLYAFTLEDNPLLSGILPNAICKINGTCVGNGFNPCEGGYGFSFSCSNLLCGCGCDVCIP